MFRKIIVPLDGSELAECVLPHAVALARLSAGEVTLLRVLPGSQTEPVDPVTWHLHKAEAQSYLESVARQMEQAGIATRATLLEGAAAEHVVEYAQEQAADLIILSSHGRSGLSEWNVSSVVQKIIWRVYTSIMIVRAFRPAPADTAGWPYRRILAPLDGSQRAECVLPVLRALSQDGQAEVTLVHVVTKPEIPRRSPLTAEERELTERLVALNQDEATRFLAQVKGHLSAETQTRLLVSDNALATLQEVAEQEAADLVVLSAHGNTCAAQYPYGSVGTGFIAYGLVPLLIVQDLAPPAADRADQAPAYQLRNGNGGGPVVQYESPA